jgi:hypothetical protein
MTYAANNPINFADPSGDPMVPSYAVLSGGGGSSTTTTTTTTTTTN